MIEFASNKHTDRSGQCRGIGQLYHGVAALAGSIEVTGVSLCFALLISGQWRGKRCVGAGHSYALRATVLQLRLEA